MLWRIGSARALASPRSLNQAEASGRPRLLSRLLRLVVEEFDLVTDASERQAPEEKHEGAPRVAEEVVGAGSDQFGPSPCIGETTDVESVQADPPEEDQGLEREAEDRAFHARPRGHSERIDR